jgi:hypothetical protein
MLLSLRTQIIKYETQTCVRAFGWQLSLHLQLSTRHITFICCLGATVVARFEFHEASLSADIFLDREQLHGHDWVSEAGWKRSAWRQPEQAMQVKRHQGLLTNVRDQHLQLQNGVVHHREETEL